MKAVVVVIAFLLFFFYSPFLKPVLAARSLLISANKGSLFGDEEIILTASSSGFTDGETIYIKGALYQDGSSNYFGYTKNGETWIKNGDSSLSQKSIQIGQWDGLIIAKSDFSDSGYKGEGGYKLKIGFYYLTGGGALSSINWSSNNLDINLNEPDPTPTNTPTPTSTLTPTSVSTPTTIPTPTKTPTPAPTLSPTPTSKPSASPTPEEILPTSVLGESTQNEEIVSPTDVMNKKSVIIHNEAKDSNTIFQKSLIAIGLMLLAACGILIFRHIKHRAQRFNDLNH